MKRNFNEPILDLDGTPTRAGLSSQSMAKAMSVILPKLSKELRAEFNAALEKECGKPLTFGSACVLVLMNAYDDEKSLDIDMRMKRMELARRIHQGGVQEIEPKDRDLVKPLLTKGFTGVLVPVVCAELLETEYAPPEAVKHGNLA